MAVVTLREVLQDAMSQRYAVGSFNAADHSMAEAILEVSEELDFPVILSLAVVAEQIEVFTNRRIQCR